MIAAKFGCTAETLRHWVRQAQRDQRLRPGPTTEERERIKQLELVVNNDRFQDGEPVTEQPGRIAA